MIAGGSLVADLVSTASSVRMDLTSEFVASSVQTVTLTRCGHGGGVASFACLGMEWKGKGERKEAPTCKYTYMFRYRFSVSVHGAHAIP